MKMSDWFESEIRLHGDIIECDDFAYAEMSCEYVVDGVDAGVAICHAVNNHDRMAGEIAELREALGLIVYADEMINEGANAHGGMSMMIGSIANARELLDKHK